MHGVSRFTVEEVQNWCVSTQIPNGKWVPCRPAGWDSILLRIRISWLVFTGKADALFWEGSEK